MENRSGWEYPLMLTQIVLEGASKELSTSQFIWYYDLSISDMMDRIINSTELSLESRVLLAKRWSGWKGSNNQKPFTVIYRNLQEMEAIKTSKKPFGEKRIKLTDKGQNLLDRIKDISTSDLYKRDAEYLETASPERLFESYNAEDTKEDRY